MIEETCSEGPAVKASLSAHPAFPAIAALWFAALLGLGTLVLPAVLVERLVAITGIAFIPPAAKPPLGLTARAVISLCASVGGAVVGLLLARKVANSSATHRRDPRPQIAPERQCHPISAHEELGDCGFDSPELETFPGNDLATETVSNDLSADEYIDEERVDTRANEAFANLDRANQLLTDLTAENPPMADQPFHQPGAETKNANGRVRSSVDPLPFAAPSLRRSSADTADEDSRVDLPAASEVTEPQEDDCSPGERPAPKLQVIDSGVPSPDNPPLEELSLVRLVERLGASLARREARLAERDSDERAPQPPIDSFDLEAAGAEDAARAIADFFGPADAIELPSEDGEEDEADERDFSSLLAMKNRFAREQEFVRVRRPGISEDSIEDADPFRSASPAVTGRSVDAQAEPAEKSGESELPLAAATKPPAPAETERSLRDALATLQRISGAA